MPDRIDFRPTLGLWTYTSVVAVIFVAIAASSFFLPVGTWLRALLVGFALLSLFGLLELVTKRITLTDDGLELVANFSRSFTPRSELASVTWAKGGGVSLHRSDGTWLHLPLVGKGNQAMVNTIRAWLHRTSQTSGPH